MKLSELIEGVGIKERMNFTDVELTGVSTDSRSIRRGELFAAIRGHSEDGHEFVPEAAGKGASAIMVERRVACSLPTLLVEDAASAVALIARRFFGDPASRMLLVGITGTNGKTSTSFMLRSILARTAGPTGLIGTVGFGMTAELTAVAQTTPAPVDLYRTLSGFLREGSKAAVMEVSSHATVQGRIGGLEFDLAVFTNITRDHLDYHGTLENYIEAKERLMRSLMGAERRKKPGIMVYNADDERLVEMAGRHAGDSISFGLSTEADVSAGNIDAGLKGTSFDVVAGSRRVPVKLRLLGSFSVQNALAAAAAAYALGTGLDDIAAGLEGVREVPGRFQVISAAEGPTVIIDYAHTPDALERVLRFCRELEPRRIATVFGCGGDRDRGKRPLMGGIAAELSDMVYVTDDNPRTEDPVRIVDEILSGIEAVKIPVRVIRNRREAIRSAVFEAEHGDIVIVAGKGHESEQIVGGQRLPFSDAAEAEEALRIRGGKVSEQS